MAAYTGTPALPALLAGDIPSAATDWAAIVGALHGGTDAWTVWTPTLTNLTLGNGTMTAKYRQLGKKIDWYLMFTLGTTSAVGTGPNFTLPVTPAAGYISGAAMGWAALANTGVSGYAASLTFNAGSTVKWNCHNAAGTYATTNDITATVPFTWGSGHTLSAGGTYEAA